MYIFNKYEGFTTTTLYTTTTYPNTYINKQHNDNISYVLIYSKLI